MIAARTNSVRVHTPEGITFSLLLASPLTRFLGCVIDVGCIAVLNSTLGYFTRALGLLSADFALAAQITGYFVISIGYGILTEWYWRGQTIGKRLLRLRVVDAQGLKLNFNQIALRNVLRCIDLLPGFYAVGGAVSLLNRHNQRLGDIAAGTIVIRHPVARRPDLDQLAVDKWNSLRDYPHLAARLRQRVSPRTAALTVDAIMRRQELEPSERLALFRELASYLKGVTPFPPEASDGVGDEQYVRNVADVLFR
ncbi:MAG: RDD family protein [Spartobacteria bacterium]